ncbi:hypothetical protein A9Q84_09455 [Halobacteriovorax marinus]|uniref:Toxin n=1 Tax=Halobacteriovorax marinus TaxID=97084 RepID=A0A1Y5F738_9BACT|nr:hypothetical protein A9Q84_09455 [Halobacteriovorax marinus]
MFEWDNKKNEEIKKRHGISFEELEVCIKIDSVIIETPNENRNQNAFLTFLNDYPIIVPFEIRGDNYRLITAWPDRRYKDE